MESVYLETTFVSYLVSLPSRDLLVAAHQQVTRDWWDQRRSQFHCVVSQVVIDEASAGDPQEIQKRLAVLANLDVLELSQAVEDLTTAILQTGIFPQRAVRDAAHIAVATVHQVEYLLTWNCRHLANAQTVRRIQRICEAEGFQLPQICTPEELMGDNSDA
jgi:hypothetical protein